MSDEKREVVFYSTREDEERLTFDTPDAAIDDAVFCADRIGDVLAEGVAEWGDATREPERESEGRASDAGKV